MHEARSKRSGFLAMFLAGALGGCAASSLAPGTGDTAATSRMFDLVVPAAKVAAATDARRAKSVQLVVYEPTAIRALDSDRVVVRHPNGEISYLSGASWNDRLPMLVKARFVEALAGSGRFRAVSNGQDKVNADLGVSSSLQSFQIEVAPSGSVARIAVQAKIVSESGGAVLASRRFEASQPVDGKDPAQHIAALNGAFGKFTEQMTNWIAASIEETLARKPRASSVVVGSIGRKR